MQFFKITLSSKEVEALVQLMLRVSLTGSEVPTFNQLMNRIQAGEPVNPNNSTTDVPVENGEGEKVD